MRTRPERPRLRDVPEHGEHVVARGGVDSAHGRDSVFLYPLADDGVGEAGAEERVLCVLDPSTDKLNGYVEQGRDLRHRETFGDADLSVVWQR